MGSEEEGESEEDEESESALDIVEIQEEDGESPAAADRVENGAVVEMPPDTDEDIITNGHAEYDDVKEECLAQENDEDEYEYEDDCEDNAELDVNIESEQQIAEVPDQITVDIS